MLSESLMISKSLDSTFVLDVALDKSTSFPPIFALRFAGP